MQKKTNIDFSNYYPFFFTIIFIIILFQYSFTTLESIFYDLRVKYDFGTTHSNEVVLVHMDEESDEFLGETYPYSYTTHSRFIKRLLADKPLIINNFVSLGESEFSPDIKNFKKSVNEFKASGGYFRFGTDMDAWGEQLPPTELQGLGYSLGLINVDNSVFARDDVCRRVILSVSGEESVHLWTANRYRELKKEGTQDTRSLRGYYYSEEADASFSLFRYSTSPLRDNKKIQQIPFHRVLVGNFPKGFFTGKIVLIGPSYISNPSNFILTPFDKNNYKTPKLLVHGQIIESLINDNTVYKLPIWFSYALCIIISIILSFLISKARPTKGLLYTVIVILSVFLISYLLFCLFGIWIYITHIVLTIFVVYYIWVPFRAIGEYQRRYAIQEETKLLKKVESLKQNFISLMSHDLKTPVAKITGLVDMLRRQVGDSQEVHQNLDSINESTKELNRFITSILDLTKIESRNLTLNKTSKDINKVIDQIVDNLKFEARSKNVVVERELSPLYPIEFDQELMKRVISNLIENGIKYSGLDSRILVKSWDDDEWVHIEIGDNGVGIPPEDVEHIFEKFYRVKNDASHSIKGTGLGLYLVKYFVELHGGKISVRSVVGEGTTFHIMLKNE